MLPRELVEELIGGSGPAGLHVLMALPDAFDGLLTILPLPLEVVGKDIVESIGRALTAAAGEILELSESLWSQRHRVHG